MWELRGVVRHGCAGKIASPHTPMRIKWYWSGACQKTNSSKYKKILMNISAEKYLNIYKKIRWLKKIMEKENKVLFLQLCLWSQEVCRHFVLNLELQAILKLFKRILRQFMMRLYFMQNIVKMTEVGITNYSKILTCLLWIPHSEMNCIKNVKEINYNKLI